MSGVIILTAVFALALAFVLGAALGFFKQFFAVETDPRVAQIRAALPGANCGACGFPGCDGYASAVASGQAGISNCPVGGAAAAEKLSALMGVAADVTPVAAVLACRGTRDHAPLKGDYIGVRSCRAAKISTGGVKLCAWACVGYGDCVNACAFGALSMGSEGLPVIDYGKCAGCARCAAECPQGLILMVPKNRKGALPLCSNRNPARAQVIKTCKNGCIKCELCVKNCPQGALSMKNGLPEVDYAKCAACGTCVQKCPTKAMSMF